MDVKIEPGWKAALSSQWDQPYFKQLTDFIRMEYQSATIFPPASKIFAAFDSCPYDRTRVIILGQDPYHDYGQANGLCFSVNDGVQAPPSLLNIFKEINQDIGLSPSEESVNLERWASQGVLLLNSVLTVRAHQAGSHRGMGWEIFTDAVIKCLADNREGLVFMLWGSYAINKGAFIDRNKHLVLTSPHPSPLSAYRGFFGNHHFSLCNDWLVKHGGRPITW
ncbi:MAG: uracil-DNA glycosylase [Muribaculaceae bacterium]|nr:uracil-DNA glycosylase [Muribaculaceae bacterium]